MIKQTAREVMEGLIEAGEGLKKRLLEVEKENEILWKKIDEFEDTKVFVMDVRKVKFDVEKALEKYPIKIIRASCRQSQVYYLKAFQDRFNEGKIDEVNSVIVIK